MKLTDILLPGRVVATLDATDGPSVLGEVVRRGFIEGEPDCGLLPDDEDRVVKVLEDRERLGSTGLKDGLAIPHGKLSDIPQLIAAMGMHKAGLDFSALDGKPSHVFIVLLSPESSGADHLKALARISRLFSSGLLQRRLMGCETREAMFDEIAAEDARI